MSWCKSESYLLLVNNEEKPKTLTPFPHPPILILSQIEILQIAKSEIHTYIHRVRRWIPAGDTHIHTSFSHALLFF